MCAAARDRTAMLELLLQKGADPHVKDKVSELQIILFYIM